MIMIAAFLLKHVFLLHMICRLGNKMKSIYSCQLRSEFPGDGLSRLQWPNNVSREQWGGWLCVPEKYKIELDEKTAKKSWCEA